MHLHGLCQSLLGQRDLDALAVGTWIYFNGADCIAGHTHDRGASVMDQVDWITFMSVANNPNMGTK